MAPDTAPNAGQDRIPTTAAYRLTFDGKTKAHVVEFVPSGFENFESATCKTCRKFLCCGFPPSYTHHAAENHAGICECKPSLVTWT